MIVLWLATGRNKYAMERYSMKLQSDKHIKRTKIVKRIGYPIFTIILCAGLLFLTALIPRDAIYENSYESAIYYNERQLYPFLRDGVFGTRQDNYADSILSNILYHIDSSDPIRSSLYSAPSSTSSSDEVTASSPHTHTYEWTEILEATEGSDGIEQYRCTTCGDVQMTSAIPAGKIYTRRFYNTVNKAAEGSTVEFKTQYWTCFSQKMIDTIKEKNLTLHVTFKYKNEEYDFIISGTDDVSAAEKDGYYGFLKLREVLAQ